MLKHEETVACWIFTFLVPLQFIYILTSNAGINLPSVSYIFFLICSVIGFMFVTVSIMSRMKSVEFYTYWIFVFLNVVILIVIIYNFDVVGYRGRDLKSAIEINVPIIIYNFGYFSIAYLILCINKDKIKSLLLVYWLIITFIIIMLSWSTGYQISLYNFSGDSYVDYLRLSDLYVILSSLLLSFYLRSNKFICIFLLSIICLFCLKSRTSLFLFLVSSVWGFYYFFKGRAFSALMILLLTLISLSSVYDTLLTIFDESRFSLLFSGSDSSMFNRDLLNDQGLLDIYKYPFEGRFGGQLINSVDRDGARWGAYMHNFISYWRQFSILSFILLLTVILMSMYSVVKVFIKRYFIPDSLLYLSLTLYFYMFFAMVFSRSYAFSYVFIGVLMPIFLLGRVRASDE